MKKRNKLNKADELYIKENPESKTAEQLSDELNLELNIITPLYVVPVVKKDLTLVEKLMVRKQSGNKVVATAMTFESEKVSEELKKDRVRNASTPDYIHRPKG